MEKTLIIHREDKTKYTACMRCHTEIKKKQFYCSDKCRIADLKKAWTIIENVFS
jgi:endogenous inhibitor of DNA gyrase (YacG/DUF329 family)